MPQKRFMEQHFRVGEAFGADSEDDVVWWSNNLDLPGGADATSFLRSFTLHSTLQSGFRRLESWLEQYFSVMGAFDASSRTVVPTENTKWAYTSLLGRRDADSDDLWSVRLSCHSRTDFQETAISLIDHNATSAPASVFEAFIQEASYCLTCCGVTSSLDGYVSPSLRANVCQVACSLVGLSVNMFHEAVDIQDRPGDIPFPP